MHRATDEKEKNLHIQVDECKLLRLDYFPKEPFREHSYLARERTNPDGDTVDLPNGFQPAQLFADFLPRPILLVHVDLNGLEPKHDIDEQDKIQSADEGPNIEEDSAIHRFDTVVQRERSHRNAQDSLDKPTNEKNFVQLHNMLAVLQEYEKEKDEVDEGSCDNNSEVDLPQIFIVSQARDPAIKLGSHY